MKRTAGLALMVLLWFQGVVHADMEGKITKHYGESYLEYGEKGLFAVELLPAGMGLRMGVNALELIIHDASDSDVAGADVTITPWMPAMGHGVPDEPRVNERGGGVYSAENVVFNMTGYWQLTVKVGKGDLADTVVFSFPEITAMGHGMKMKVPESEELDVSTGVVSAQGHFRVAYEVNGGEVPVNNLHSWTLEVKTSEGEPVTGAEISLVGDMPQHGHGLPTEPEVTGDLGDGRYRVEGLKFSMPGWWVVTFHVNAGETKDSASFNLYLR